MSLIKNFVYDLFTVSTEVAKKTGTSRLAIGHEMFADFLRYGASPNNYKKFDFYGMPAETKRTFVTNRVSRKLIKKYNDPRFVDIFEDKVRFADRFSEFFGREWINSDECTESSWSSFAQGKTRAICKPQRSSQGRGIRVIDPRQFDAKQIKEEFTGCIIEEFIQEHHEIASFYDRAVNCLRIISIFDKGSVNILASNLTFGAETEIANASFGGVVTEVDAGSGIIISDGGQFGHTIFEKHPYSGKQFKGTRIPYWNETVELIDRLGRLVPEVRYVGWDIAITEKGPIVIEGNTTPGYTYFQRTVERWERYDGAIQTIPLSGGGTQMNNNAYLYERGFYLTNDAKRKVSFANPEFWNKSEISDGYIAYVHKDETLYVHKRDNRAVFLFGHAYDPIKMVADENRILELLLAAESRNEFWNLVNELTGIFLLGVIEKGRLLLIGDAACIQCASYGVYEGHIHVASHTHMLEDVCCVQIDPYVSRLVHYRFYRLFGKALPGDITPYKEFKRLIPNHYVVLTDRASVHRFFPTETYVEYEDGECEATVKSIANLMHNNLKLITEKWRRPAISMTGGCDSKTTLSCTNGLYDKFKYFSYISSEEERVDAEAAHRICGKLGLEHMTYVIPAQDADIDGVEEVRETLRFNDGDIGKSNPNDVRKRAFFAALDDFDVEVKSWVSECGRAYYNKRFAKSSFPAKPTPRYLTSLYKVFITNRKLVGETDQVFKNYMEKYLFGSECKGYPWQEIFFWEFRVAGWNGLVITGEHKYSYDITIPYNNRLIIDALLRFPSRDRINDIAYKKIRDYMNPLVDESGIAIINVKHTEIRARLERFYLEIMSRFPF